MTERRSSIGPQERGPGWQYLLYCDRLESGLQRHDEARELYRSGNTSTSGVELSNRRQVAADMSERVEAAALVLDRLDALLDPETRDPVIDGPGGDGQPDAVARLADDVADVVGDLYRWAHEVRSVQVPEKFRPLYDDISLLIELPVSQIEDYVARLAREVGPAVAALRAPGSGGDPPLDLGLELTADPAVMARITEDVEVVKRPRRKRRRAEPAEDR